MKYKEISDKTEHELEEMLKSAKVKLGKLRFELANKALKDSSQVRKTRKEIARIVTALRTISNPK